MLEMSNEIHQLRFKRNNSNTFFVKSDNIFIPLKIEEINSISATGNFCTIYTDSQKEFVLRISLTKIKCYLTAGNFVQINKKDLINTNKIKIYDPQGVVLVGVHEFSVSRRFKKILEDSLQFLP